MVVLCLACLSRPMIMGVCHMTTDPGTRRRRVFECRGYQEYKSKRCGCWMASNWVSIFASRYTGDDSSECRLIGRITSDPFLRPNGLADLFTSRSYCRCGGIWYLVSGIWYLVSGSTVLDAHQPSPSLIYSDAVHLASSLPVQRGIIDRSGVSSDIQCVVWIS
jgi:hypothetical protein